jgi:hypothetical protein
MAVLRLSMPFDRCASVEHAAEHDAEDGEDKALS